MKDTKSIPQRFVSFQHEELFAEYNKILDEKQTNPDIDRSTELEALHHSLNELILDDLGFGGIFNY